METQNLEEVIFQLQRFNLEPTVGRLVEEAAELYAGGRHLEARALVEKAEAMKFDGVWPAIRDVSITCFNCSPWVAS